MRPLHKLKPANGISSVLHLLLVLVLPLLVFILVRLNFAVPAFILIVLSKWRVFAVHPRFWAANLRANSVDLMVGFSAVLFIAHYDSIGIQLMWMVLYGIWLTAVKPGASLGSVAAQACIAQFVALSALYLTWADGPVFGLVLATGAICALAARHFLDAFDEPYARMLAWFWGYFAAALAWLTSHWLLFYGGIALPTLLLSTLGYGMAGLYYLDHNDRLSRGVRRQIVFVMIAVVVVILAFSDWGDKVV
jgi:hypothetical protein